jgi:hypothetical protein
VLATRLTRPLHVFVERLTALNDVAVAGLKNGIRSLARGSSKGSSGGSPCTPAPEGAGRSAGTSPRSS